MTDDSGAKWRLTADGRMYRKAWQEYVNGDIYDGEWVDGKREGRGVYVYKNGNKYEGNYKNNELHGFGIYNYNGFEYRGEYKKLWNFR